MYKNSNFVLVDPCFTHEKLEKTTLKVGYFSKIEESPLAKNGSQGVDLYLISEKSI
jgi:hypothetical protein